MFEDRLEVPNNPSLRKMLFHEVHNSPIGGHPGEKSTLSHMCRSFHWPLLTDDVRAWVLSADLSNRKDTTNKARDFFMNSGRLHDGFHGFPSPIN